MIANIITVITVISGVAAVLSLPVIDAAPPGREFRRVFVRVTVPAAAITVIGVVIIVAMGWAE